MLRSLLPLTIGLLCMVTPSGGQTVAVTLSSPQDGLTVAGGQTIEWSIWFTVSEDTPSTNDGLALLSVDLVQDGGNPAGIELQPAEGVPAGMENFSRPDGISNPGEGGGPTGYVGVQRGSIGAYDLIQIGGGQNNFGVASPPGSGVGENAIVDAAVGHGGSVLLASGSFEAPSACGEFTVRIANGVANTLDSIETPPTASPASPATVTYAAQAITFTVGLTGDIDGDNAVGLPDLSALLTNFGLSGSGLEGDLDGDGSVDLADLSALLENFGLSC